MSSSEVRSTARNKRVLGDVTPTLSVSTSSNKKPRDDDNNMSQFISQQHLDTVLAELEYERKMRQIDQTRARQVQDRLAQELTLVKTQFEETSQLLQQVQDESERITTELSSSRNSALSELQRLRMQNQSNQNVESSLSESHQVWKEKCRRLQEQIKAQAENEERMRDELDALKQQMQEQLEQLSNEVATRAATNPLGELLGKTVEEAPPAVLKELNRSRVQLAETERQNRQLQHRYESLQQRNRKLVQEQEEDRISKARLVVVEQKMSDLHLKYAESKAKLESWTVFGESLKHELNRDSNNFEGISVEKPPGAADGFAPEVASVLRFLETAQSQVKDIKHECQRKQQQVEFLTMTLEGTETKLKQSLEQSGALTLEKKELQSELESHKVQRALLEAQQSIAQREVDSLRALIKTFDNMPLLSPTDFSQSEILASPKLQTSLKTIQVRLESVQDERDLVAEERDRLASELEALTASQKEQQEELDSVKEKFGKLREALQAERRKVELAEERANAAESLAGKGLFNPDKVRALHLQETPLIEALREEVTVLRRQLEAITGGDNKSASKRGAPLDPEKLSQRLKESFKEQIALFREGVYLMTGFKVDMLAGTDRPTFRVRSVFAEQEEDHLILKWPKSEPVVSLDILNTDLAKQLAATDSYHYMSKFQNLPAFLAAVQLSLFANQTVM